MPTISNALELGIQTLADTIQMTPASPGVAIIRTSQYIIQVINANQGTRRDEERLAVKVLDIAIACTDGLKKLHENEIRDTEIDRICHDLYGCLESIMKGIQDVPKAGFFARLLTHSSAKRRIQGWEADLEHISLHLASQVQLRTTKVSHTILAEYDRDATERSSAMEERIRHANQEALELIRSEVLKKTREKLHKSSFAHFPPAASPIFYGRTPQVNYLVESLVKVPAYHAVLGPGGIGKTTLALNMLHEPRIVEVYGKHRYFMACETTVDACGIVAGLADIFSLNEGAFLAQFRGLCQSIKSNMVFLLDNFETPWERKETRQKVEDLLTDLSSIPNLSIVITLRGAERPGGIRWSHPCLPVLGPLEISAARQTFLAVSDIGNPDESVDRLLKEVEFFPLAITLLAAQAQYASCSFLLDQWKTSKTSMITRGWDSRLSSLDVSISLSLASSRFISNPQALSLLQVLSLLPDGATVEELRQMTPDVIDIHKCVSTLLQVALANMAPYDRVRVLAPIREYMQLKHPIHLMLLKPVFSYHSELARYARESEWTAERLHMDAKLKTCIGNIHSVIRFSLGEETLTHQAINATVNVARFRRSSHSGSIYDLLEQSVKIAGGSQKWVQLAGCLQEIGVRIWYNDRSYIWDCSSALGCLQESAKILRHASSSESYDMLIDTLLQLCRVTESQEHYEESLQLAREAVSLISPETSPAIGALAHICLGCILTKTRHFQDSQKALELAGTYFHPASFPALSHRLSLQKCQLYFYRNMYSQIVKTTTLVLTSPTLEESDRARLLFTKGRSCIILSRFREARRDLHQAIQSLASSGVMLPMCAGNCLIGLSYLACGDFTESTLFFERARQFGYFEPIFDPNLALAMLELHRSRPDKSITHLKSSSYGMASYPTISPSRLYRLEVQCQVQIRQGRATDALSSCVTATIIAHGIQDMWEVAASILWLGDFFFFAQQDVSTSRACYQCFLDMVRYLGNRRWIACALLRIGVTDYVLGDLFLTDRRLNQASRFFEETGGKLWVEFCQEIRRLIEGRVHHVSRNDPASLHATVSLSDLTLH